MGTATFVGVLFGAGVAQAHDFICEKRVALRPAPGAPVGEFGPVLEVENFPATLVYDLVARNVHPTATSVLESAADPLIEELKPGFDFLLGVQRAVPVDGFVRVGTSIEVRSAQQCRDFAAKDGTADRFIDNVFVVTFDGGSSQCTARVICPAPPEDVVEGPTRPTGFFMTHIDAVTACLGGGGDDLDYGGSGVVPNLDTPEKVLGLLWGSPAEFAEGTSRSDLARQRFLLHQQVVAAACNLRLFGTVDRPLFMDAVDALTEPSQTNCTRLEELTNALSSFNDSGASLDLPEDFEPGPATPVQAESIANDVSFPSNQSCSVE